jgi:hypothetical protein
MKCLKGTHNDEALSVCLSVCLYVSSLKQVTVSGEVSLLKCVRLIEFVPYQPILIHILNEDQI